MAFQTSVLRDGEWVIETIDLQTVLNASKSAPRRPPPAPSRATPVCGVLTRTVVESPVMHWILPARLRSTHQNDIAFVGDHYVQISEFRKDEQLHPVARKSDFGSRIRNARVVGSVSDRPRSEDPVADSILKGEDEDISASASMSTSGSAIPVPRASGTSGADGHLKLPPQLLVLILESGITIFLFVRQGQHGGMEFVTSRFNSPVPRKIHPGFHFAVDPRSRYMALACAEGLFIVYELENMATLGERYASLQPLKPIKNHRPRAVLGVIHKMEFLYPWPDDDHVILLLIVVKNGKSRMIHYEWRAGDNLQMVLGEEKHGHRLPTEHQIPLLVIPLTVRSSFLAVSQNSIGVCKDALQGPPNIEEVDTEILTATDSHQGMGHPLWTAWSRPFRRLDYHRNKDNIYLAREDGVVMYLEIDSEDILSASSHVGNMSNISTAFTTVYSKFEDILIIAGDSSPGGIWKMPSRKTPSKIGTVPNWTPAIDFATTYERTSRNRRDGTGSDRKTSAREPGVVGRSDRIFGVSRRGSTGAITEYRYGLQASISLFLEYGAPTKRSWVFPAHAGGAFSGMDLLLALPDSSAVLHLPEEFSEATVPDAVQTKYDMASRTLAASRLSDQAIVQITEVAVTIISSSQRFRRTHEQVTGIEGAAVDQAAIQGNLVVVSTRSIPTSQGQICLLEVDSMAISVLETWHVEGEVTALAVCVVGGNLCIAAGVWWKGRACVMLYSVDDMGSMVGTMVDLEGTTVGDTQLPIDGIQHSFLAVESINSIIAVEEKDRITTVVIGTRSGHLITLWITAGNPLKTSVTKEKLGDVSVDVHKAELPSGEICALVSCDGGVILLTDLTKNFTNGFKNKHRVWLTDAADPSAQSPSVHSITVLPHDMSLQDGRVSLVVLSGDQIIFAGLQLQPGPVPRHIFTSATPTKVIYSHRLGCLIVALQQAGDMPTIAFIDPDTGDNICRPTDKSGERVEFVSGLGIPGDKIYGLYEWLYPKDGMTFLFIIVTTKGGQLLIISAEKEDTHMRDERSRIRYYTRYRRKGFGEPIYSVVGDAEGLILCVGKSLHWETLDLAEKKLKPRKKFVLESPATSLREVKGRVYALTQNHSLEVVSLAGSKVSGSHDTSLPAGGVGAITGDGGSNAQDEMLLLYCDRVSRSAVHMVDIGSSEDDGKAAWPMTLLCDRQRGFVGLWAPRDHNSKHFEVLFEGTLPASIRRFCRGHGRPPWERERDDRMGPQFGKIPSTDDGSEILGMCLDGSVQHFTLLKEDAWRFLRLVQNLANRSERTYPFTFQKMPLAAENFGLVPTDQPRSMMHIDGDMLQRCYDSRGLEHVVNSHPLGMGLMRDYLDQLEEGKWTAKISGVGDSEGYFEVGYNVLEYFLRPAL